MLLNQYLAQSGRAAPQATSRRTHKARMTRKRSLVRRAVETIPVACAVAEIVTDVGVRLRNRRGHNSAVGCGCLVIAPQYAQARRETHRNRH